MLSKSPFWLQLGSRETPPASHPETEAKRCPQCNQRQAVWATWVWCELFTSRRDPRTGELTCSSRRHAQSFLPSHCCSKHSRAYLSGPLWSSSQKGAMRSVQTARWARTQICSRSLNLVPNSNRSRPSLLSSHAAHWEDPKWSLPLVLDTVLSDAMESHWTQESYEGLYGIYGQMVLCPLAYVNLWPWLETRKSPTCFSPPCHVPWPGSAQVHKSFSEPVALQIKHTQTSIVCMLNTDLSMDHQPLTSLE